MKTQLLVVAVLSLILILPAVHNSSAQTVPEWIKNNAGWWADGTISESEFVLAIQFLIKENVIEIPQDIQVTQSQSDGIPDWVKNTALWWSQGVISDGEFVNAIQFLISSGVISVEISANTDDSKLDSLKADLEACSEIKKVYKRSDCQREAKSALTAYDYKSNGKVFEAGPVSFYYKGNGFEILQSGQALLDVKLLAENTKSDENISLMCTGPAICNYDVWDGEKSFKYAGTDFTNGQIVLKPGESREFAMLFGPNIGYGGTKFEYDPSKEYVFRVMESWGSTSIPMQTE